jgi:hypothetical protein
MRHKLLNKGALKMPSRRGFPMILMLFCNACASQPIQNGKATPELTPPKAVEVRTEVAFSGQGRPQIDTEVLLQPAVRACLQQDLKEFHDRAWRVDFAAHLDPQG